MKTLYIGAKCVPSFYIGSGGSSEWTSGVPFEPLTVVTYNGTWFISKKPVPAGAAAPEAGEYWAKVPGYVTDVTSEELQAILDDIGDLDDLDTTAKTDLVSAVNEVKGETTELRDDLEQFIEDFGGSVDDAVNYWLDEHPEATTTVQDHSLTFEKLVIGTLSYVTPEMYGAKGDGVTDDTVAINEALESGNPVIFGQKTYIVSVENEHDSAIIVPSNSVLYFDGTNIQLQASNAQAYQIISVIDSDNVLICGNGTITGDRETHTGTGGEWGMVISISGCNNVRIEGITLCNGWGDGIYIANSENIIITECIIKNNRRNNISIISGNHISVNECYLYKPNGTSPQSNIAIEANTTDDIISNVTIQNCICTETVGTYAAYITTKADNNHVKIINCKFDKPFTTNVLSGDHNCFDIIDTEIKSMDSYGAINIDNTPQNTYVTYDNVTFIGGAAVLRHTGEHLHNLVVKNSRLKDAEFSRMSLRLGGTDITGNIIDVIAEPSDVSFTGYVASLFPSNTENTLKVANSVPFSTPSTAPTGCFFSKCVYEGTIDAGRAFVLSNADAMPKGQVYTVMNGSAVRYTIEVASYAYDETTGTGTQLIIVPSGKYCKLWNINNKIYYKIV